MNRISHNSSISINQSIYQSINKVLWFNHIILIDNYTEERVPIVQ